MRPTAARSIPVSRPSVGAGEEAAVIEVLRSGWVTQGPKVAEFESKFAEYVGAPHAVAVSSCTAALHLSLLAAGIKPGDEVLCPSLSFIATANAIVHAGGTPVFVDITASTYNMDPDRIEEAITSRTRAILVVHQVGLPGAMNRFNQIAGRNELAVIEDAACAIGSEYNGERLGQPHSQMACFSFHPRKILTTGEGGIITTADADAGARLRRLRQHGMTVSDVARHSSSKVMIERYDEVGYNYRMTDLQAAVGLVQLQRLEGMLNRRRTLAERYSAALSRLGWLTVPYEPAGCRHNYQSYMVRLNEHSPLTRDELMQHLLDCGIASRRGVMPIHREQPYCSEQWDSRLPVTNLVADTSLILPLFHEMGEDEQDYVISCIRNSGRESRLSKATNAAHSE